MRREPEFFGKPDCLTLTVSENLGGFHVPPATYILQYILFPLGCQSFVAVA
jgi:hypothetical protein